MESPLFPLQALGAIPILLFNLSRQQSYRKFKRSIELNLNVARGRNKFVWLIFQVNWSNISIQGYQSDAFPFAI